MPSTKLNESYYMILQASIVIASIHLILLSLLKQYQQNGKDRQESYQLSYLATNFTINLCLGVMGIYHMTYTLPNTSSVDETQRITGFDHYMTFGVIQIGYNLWALPVGYFLVSEGKAMLTHHIAAIFVASMSVFFTNGFRYYAPFFLGAIEISSVPLAVINYLKRNKEWTQKHCPLFFNVIKLVFAVLFISLRVFLWNPRMYDVLQLASVLFSTCDSSLCSVVVGGFWSCGVFLTILQCFWSFLIVKGVLSIFFGDKKPKKKEV